MTSIKRALVIGRGSIGQRHRAVLETMGCEVKSVSKRLGEYSSIEKALSEFAAQYIVVASRTIDHESDLLALQGAGFAEKVLIEKPLFKDFNPSVIPVGKIKIGVAYQMRFNPMVSWLKSEIQSQKICSAHFYVGQYLPMWRPDRDYTQIYSAKRAEGGGVLRDLSHELDLSVWLFGCPERLTADLGHFSSLKTDVEDTVSVLLKTESTPVVGIDLNCLDRNVRRRLLVVGDQHSYEVDFISGQVFKDGQKIDFGVWDRNTPYQKMHEAFLSGQRDVCSFSEGLEVMRLIQKIEIASERKEWVSFA